MNIYLLISGIISVIVSIAVALLSLGFFFRDGDDSTNSLREFNDSAGDPYGISFLTTKFGLWLVLSGGAGCLCFFILLKTGKWLHH